MKANVIIRNALCGQISMLVILVAAALVAGCGSDTARYPSGAGSVQGRGTLAFTVTWPAPTRLIPSASNSIKFSVSTDAAGLNVVAGVVVNRPATSAVLNNVPAGVDYITATAYPGAGATGVPQAMASGQVFVNPGKVTPVILTLASTVDHFDFVQTAGPGTTSPGVPSAQFTFPTGTAHAIQLLATAKDSSGNTVVVDSGPGSNLTWQSDTPTVATVSPTTGSLVTVTGVTPGSAKLTLTYAEGGVVIKTAIVQLTVTQYVPTFVATVGPMTTPRAENTATLLPSGKVLIAGGSFGELYDPASGQFSVTGALVTSRTKHAATLLKDGTVLITGGDGSAPPPGASQAPGTNALNGAEIYSGGTFAPTASGMTTAREYHSSTLLASGKVLIAGGWDGTTALSSAEIYDPAAKTFTAVPGGMSIARFKHTATLLNDGTVLIAGGDNGFGSLASAELFDPALNGGAGGFRNSTLAMSSARESQTATLFTTGPLSGKVLVAGGASGASGLVADLYDPTAGAFTALSAAPMASNHFGAAAVEFTTGALAGKVLITGGRTQNVGGAILNTAEVFDPTAAAFTSTSDPMTAARHTHTATLLNNGIVLIAGGSNGAANLASAEVTSSTSRL